MDRALFFACKNDRESFCGKVESGKGRVYQCLMDNMNVSFCNVFCHARFKEATYVCRMMA